MKTTIKILAAVLTLFMLFGVFAACGENNTDKPEENKEPELAVSTRKVVELGGASSDTSALVVEPDLTLVKDEDFATYEYWEQYKATLLEYYQYLEAAKAQTDVSAKYALYAIAEAKLLESGAFLPTTTEGGNYAISRVVPYTANNVLWGLDNERFENILVADKFITVADREVLKAKYVELKGTGTYTSWAKNYLTEKGYSLKSTYSIGYSSDPVTWDILQTYLAADSRAIINTIEGLLSYDNEGRLTYALAENVTVSEDGLTYTFTLRDGLKWVTQNGEVYGDLVAQDFVDGMQHMLDTNDALYTLVMGIIANAEEYLDGKVEFSEVGVKAIDEKTVAYTLCQPTSYFLTMLEYNTFMPYCKDYAESNDKFGTSADNILYCGPYIVENHTAENKIVFKANPHYWNKDNITINTITWNYNDGKDVTKGYNDAVAGVIDGAGLNNTTIMLALRDKLFNDYAYVSSTNATTFAGFVNVERAAYETIKGYGMESGKTAEEKAATKQALKNANFRNAVLKAVDRVAYNAAKDGEATALNSIRNMYTPGTFVKLTRPITIKMGEENVTFPIGTYYGEIVQAQLTADGSSLKVWNPTGGDGDGSSDGFDGWYNPEAAKAHLAAAIEELAAEGLVIDAENPIKVDLPYYKNEIYTAAAQALKQSVEAALEGKVIVNLVPAEKVAGWYYAGYYCNSGAECNYDIYDCSGWGPDYGDPATYLNTFLPVNGDMLHVLGIR